MLWTKTCPKHFSDENLLGHADGELSWARELRVARHLRRCWECRARLAELEAQAQSVAAAFADSSFLGPDGLGRARDRFRQAEERFEEVRPLTKRTALMPSLRLPAVAVVVVVAACGVGTAVWKLRAPSPSDVLADARHAETAWNDSQPFLHVRMQVEMSEARPVALRQAGTVEMWSDRDGRRSALLWRDREGVLKYALWRPGGGRERVFRAGGRDTAASGISVQPPLARLLEGEPDLGRLEEAFLAWLGSHDWRPIGLSDHASLFASAGGVTMRAERTRAESGRPAIRLLFGRPDTNVNAEIVLELDAVTLRPRVERLRLSSGGRVVELKMTLERSDPVSAAELSPGRFEPESAVGVVAALRHSSVPERRRLTGETASMIEPKQPDREQVDSAQVGAEYVIHHAGACLGGAIEVVRESPDSVIVRGQTANRRERTELLAQLAGLRSHSLLRIELGTLEDRVVPQAAGARVREETFRSPQRSPIHDMLEGALGSGARATEFTNRAVSSSDQAMAHAWALARLAQLYGEPAARLRPESGWLLETMVREHLIELTGSADRLTGSFEPLLSLARDGERGASEPRPVPDAPWDSSLLEVFEETRGVDRLVQGLAAGAGLEGRSVEAAAGELRAGLLSLRDRLRVAAVAVKAGFDRNGPAARRH